MGIMDEHVKQMATDKLKALKDAVKITFFKPENGCEMCGPIEELIDEVIAINPKITKEVLAFEKNSAKAKEVGVDKAPALVMSNKSLVIHFFGFPGGYEFETFLNDLVDLSKGGPELSSDIISQVRKIDFPVHMQVFVTPQCPYCAGAVKVAHDFAMLNHKIKGDAIEVMEFQALGQKYQIMSVPKTIINEKIHVIGTYPPDALLKKIMELKK